MAPEAIELPVRELFREPEDQPARPEMTILDAYLQELVGCEGAQRIDQWTWVVQGWDEHGCMLKVRLPNTTTAQRKLMNSL